MFRSRIVALAGTVAAAAACTVFATSAASAAPAPAVSPSPACGLCWTPGSAANALPQGTRVGATLLQGARLGATVGSAAASLHF